MNFPRKNQGFSLIELMVGVVIGLIVVLVIGQVTAVFEAQKRASTGTGGAQTNGATALAMLEQEARMAGFGLFLPNLSIGSSVAARQACPRGVNIRYATGATVIASNGLLAPLRIFDGTGANGSDEILVTRSDADFSVQPVTIKRDLDLDATPRRIIVDAGAGFHRNQVFIVAPGGEDGTRRCTLFQLSENPVPVAIPAPGTTPVNITYWGLPFNTSLAFPYNASPPAVAHNISARLYRKDDVVINMGYSPPPTEAGGNLMAYRPFVHQRYAVRECDGQPKLTVVDPSQTPAPFTCANSQNLVDEIIDLQAQYGVSAAGGQDINNWVEPTGEWAHNALDADHINRIKAVRIAVVARSPHYIKNNAACSDNPSSTPSLSLFTTPNISFGVPTGADNCQHYRYRVFSTVVPLKNVILSGI